MQTALSILSFANDPFASLVVITILVLLVVWKALSVVTHALRRSSDDKP